MLKSKKNLIILFLLSVACFTAWAFLTFSPAKAVNGADIVIEDDFTSTNFIEGGNGVENSHAYEYFGVSSPKGFSEAGYGLIPCKDFSHDLYRPDDGYIIYKVQADDGFYFEDLTLDLTTYVSHCSHPGYIGYDKTNIKAYVATEKTAFQQVFAHCPTGGGGEYLGLVGSASERINNATETSLDLTNHVVGASVVYIKIELLHLTYEEIEAVTTSSVNSYLDVDNGFVKRLGVSLLDVRISAGQTVEGIISTPVSISDDYTTTSVANSTNIVESGHLLSYPDHHGALPSDVWDAYINTDDAYAVYKITAPSGSLLSNLAVSLNLGLGTSGGLYNWWDGNMGNANVYVDVSVDGGVTYTNEYDVLYDQTLYKTLADGTTKVNPFKAGNYDEDGNAIPNSANLESLNKVNPMINMPEYSGQEFYVRVRIVHPTPSEADKSYATTGLPMGRCAVQFYGITISAMQETMPVIEPEEDTTGEFVIEDDFQNLLQGVEAWKVERSVSGLTTYNYGSAVHGVIPANTWGTTVDTANGYALYQIPLNGNGIINTLKDLKLNVSALLNGKTYSGAVVISYGYDGENYTELFRTTTSGIVVEAQSNITCDFNVAILSEQAKSAKTLYVKILVEHTTANSVALQNVAVKLLNVKFSGKSAFTMEEGAGIRFNSDGKGLKFTTLIDKEVYSSLVNAGYELLFGTVIMPYDYIATYGDITVDNLFTENGKYCWGTPVEGKALILNGTATLNENYNEDYHSFNYSILNILQENIDEKFVARSYLRLKKDGVEKFILAEYTNLDVQNNVRSVASVAQSVVGASAVSKEVIALRNDYLNKVKGKEANYTVRHVYLNGDDIYKVTTTTHTAKAGLVISAEESALSGYSAVASASASGNGYVSSITGTVLADGSLELVRYYTKNA